MAICDRSLAVAPGRSKPGLPPERRRAIVDYAKASYVFDSVNNDPGLTKGIDNVLLLLLQFVLQVTDEGKTLPDNIGLHAGDRLLERFRHCARLTRSVRRWLSEHTMLFVAIAEHMAEAMKQEDLPSPPLYPVYGIPRYVKIEGPAESHPVLLSVAPDDACGEVHLPFGRAQLVGTWKMEGFIDLPLPDWWHGLNRRRPARAAVFLDGIAHEILTKASS